MAPRLSFKTMSTVPEKSVHVSRSRHGFGSFSISPAIILSCMLLLGLLLSACASAPPPVPTDPQVTAAQTASARGDFAQAAQLWEAVAAGAVSQPANDANVAYLNAADNWWLAGMPVQSLAALDQVSGNRLGAADSARESLLRGELALEARNIVQAEFYLAAAGNSLPRGDMSRLASARQTLEQLRTDPDAALLVDIAALIEEGAPLDSNSGIEVIRLLEQVPSARLATEALQPTRLGQWAALTLYLRSNLLTGTDMLEAAAEWTTLNPLGPVNEQTYLELAWQYGQRIAPPGRIAVLLPTEGPLEAAGDAIRDGIVAGWLDNPARSELVFVPVAEDPLSAVAAYRTIEDGGFQWVIGPLRRESVDAVVALPDASVPALLLNWPQSTAAPLEVAPESETMPTGFAQNVAMQPTDFFSISLSQEAEAEAVARRMLAQDHQRTILLRVDNGWGERTETAFIEEYLAGGGEIVAIERFSASDADHSEKLTRLLQIEDGRERRSRLQSLLNLPLEFEDSRRDDFGAFFMAADPTLGRQLKPQLRFFDAGSKPVYAMSRIYSGEVDPNADIDLNGVQIPSTRWALQAQDATQPQLVSLRDGTFGSLYALGQDAWNLLPWLDMMSQDPDFLFPGLTGTLRMDQDNRLQREPVWAVFRGGRPTALPVNP